MNKLYSTRHTYLNTHGKFPNGKANIHHIQSYSRPNHVGTLAYKMIHTLSYTLEHYQVTARIVKNLSIIVKEGKVSTLHIKTILSIHSTSTLLEFHLFWTHGMPL